MALSISRTPLAADGAAAAVDWRSRVTDVIAGATLAVSSSNVEALDALLGELAAWENPQRRFQALGAVVETVLGASGRSQPDQWLRLYVCAARHLLDELEREPREPVLLNQAGVLLYEATELRGAEALFRAAYRLDPTLPFVARNLEGVRRRKRAGTPPRLRPPLSTEAAALGERARRVAGRARPVSGLSLSLCMIVKDEEEMLPGCLEAVHEVVDEIIVVDTGSSDRTAEIARSFGAKVVDFPWNGSFADARNISLEHATGDWILQLDADEHVVAEDAAKLRQLLGRTWREGFYLVETHYTGGEDSAPSMTNMTLRLWRNRPEYRFEGRIHEQKTQSMPTYLPSRFESTTVRMLHYGYMRSVMAAKDKSRRNIALLEQEAAEAPSPFNAYNLGSEYLALADPRRALAYLERAWSELKQTETWNTVGYVPILASRLARACRESGDWDGADRVVEEALAAFPDHTDLVLEAAMAARDRGDLRRAAELAERCLEMGDAPAKYAAAVGSGTFLALTLLAEARSAIGDTAAAERLLVRSLAEHPEYPAPILPLVELRLARGDAPEEALAGVIAEGPSAMLLVGAALLEAGHATDAEGWFRRTLERQPANGAARVGLTEALLSQRRYDEARREADAEDGASAVAASAASAALFASGALGDAAGIRSRLDAAARLGVPAYDLDLYAAWAASIAGAELPSYLAAPAAATAATALEALLRVADVGAFATLVPVFEAIGIDAREKRELLARLYFRRGFLESAADEWIAVVREHPDAPALVGLAQVALAQGLPEDAAMFAREAAAIAPEHEEAAAVVAAITETYPQAG